MSQADLIKKNQRVFKQNFNRNYKIYKEIMNSINVDLRLINTENEIINNFTDSQNKYENKAVVFISDINHIKEELKKIQVIKLQDEDLEGYQAYVEVRDKLDNIYHIDDSLLSFKEKNALKAKFAELQKTISTMPVEQVKKFERYYDYSLNITEKNLELIDLQNKYKDACERSHDYKELIRQSNLLNDMRKKEVSKEKISHLNYYVEKIRKTYGKFTKFNKTIYGKKIKRIDTDEKRMTF